jgi:hypothetical protein
LRERFGCSGEQGELLRIFVDRDRLDSRAGLDPTRYARLSTGLCLVAIL